MTAPSSARSIDIGQSHGIGPTPIPGRESHTSDLARLEARLDTLRRYPRAAPEQPLREDFWQHLTDMLEPCQGGVGYHDLDAPDSFEAKGPPDIQQLGARVGRLGLLNPIHPTRLAEALDLPVETVLLELLMATKVGLARMRWAPECHRCGSAVLIEDQLGNLPDNGACWSCGAPNHIHSLDKIMATFTLAPDVLYVLANNYACTPSQESMKHNQCFAPMAATNSGSGFRYSFGSGKEAVRGVLPAGRYRMHCPVSMTDHFLVVERDADASDAPLEVDYRISEWVVDDPALARKTLTVPHGRLHINLFPDTHSFFVLWLQDALDEEVLLRLPAEERHPYTSATDLLHHPTFRLFRDQVVPGGTQQLELAETNLMFLDIVGSTDLYAHLGDGKALELVRAYFEAIFSVVASQGRIVKTIGDAVMAAFPTPETALLSAAEAMRVVAEHCTNPQTQRPLAVRVGIHCGPALVVPLNGINDFFGQTVNITARVEAAANPSELLITEALLADPAARSAYTRLTNSDGYRAGHSRKLALKGVEKAQEVRSLHLALSGY